MHKFPGRPHDQTVGQSRLDIQIMRKVKWFSIVATPALEQVWEQRQGYPCPQATIAFDCQSVHIRPKHLPSKIRTKLVAVPEAQFGIDQPFTYDISAECSISEKPGWSLAFWCS
ncbi:hypothetical protein A7X88_10955 [Stenotrophomonas maltophilia]|nr:hypothetical protein A7X60_13135 [Stenotrophomonas maltophilia]PZT25870.1 hypothetical protein A7X88_10955 [Stenotrophomonas maltophilia]